ncbi:HYR-like domain-containing protein, partial [Flavobacterium soyangense]|nr:hypothetical protein [Flavobacterium soyangense]
MKKKYSYQYRDLLSLIKIKKAINKSNIFVLLLAAFFLVGTSFTLKAQSDIYESYAILNINGGGNTFYDLQASTANPNFQGANLGAFYSGNTLLLNGAQNKTYKCATDQITNPTNFYYRIYKTTDAPPVFLGSTIFWISDDGLTGLNCGGSDQNQTWQSVGANINVLNGLTSGYYYLEIYTAADYTYTANGGGSSTHTANNGGSNYKATFTVDNPPTAVCANYTAQLDATGNITINATEIDGGSTDDFGIASLTASQTTFTCANLGANSITLTVTDSSGQTDTCIATVTVVDNQAPTFTLSPASLTIACSASSLPAATNGSATATDNCASPTIAFSDVVSAVSGNNKTITRTWTATDANANVSSYVQTITVTDTQAPTFTLSPASLTIACSASSLPAATNGPAAATDNCASPTIAFSDVVSAVSGNNKTITRTWTATDANANVSSYVQTITVTDTQAPTFTLSPASLTIACSASSLPAATNGPATATDNCATPTIGYSDVISAISGNNKTITRTWTATDANANVSSYVQIITVTDTQAPTFTLSPASLTIACSASSLPAATNGPATATDNCASPTIAFSDVISAISGNNKTITRTWTATDANANVSSYVQIITVTDTQA